MPLPTLLREGFLVPQNPKDAKKFENIVPKDFIMNFLSDRMPKDKNTAPKTKATKAGDRVLVLKASTGSGKSTALVSNLYRTFHERVNKNIAVTQPRILTAVDISLGLPEHEPLLLMGKNIGYSTSEFKRKLTEPGIIYMTVETLVQELLLLEPAQMMKKYGFIMIDEVHERDLSTDNCLFLLKKFLEANYTNRDCPFVILTSATFDESIFLNYFDVPSSNYMVVEGFTYEKTSHWPTWNSSNYSKTALKTALKIHLEDKKYEKCRDILVFMSTTAEIETAADEVKAFNTEIYEGIRRDLDAEIDSLYIKGGDEKKYMLPVVLTGASYKSGEEEYRNIFAPHEALVVSVFDKSGKRVLTVSPARRVFLATNVAETGVTIDTLKHCIDTGYAYTIEFNPELGCSIDLRKPITQGASTQRKGRVGRKAPGDWYPVYNKECFELLLKDQYAKIMTSDVTDNILSILINEQETEESESNAGQYQKHTVQSSTSYKVSTLKDVRIKNLDFIEFPSADALMFSLRKLNVLGFIDEKYKPTVFGFYANMIRFIPPELKRLIFSGYAHKVSIFDLITIVSIIYKGSLYDKNTSPKIPIQNGVFQTVKDDFLHQLCTLQHVMEHMEKTLRKEYSANNKHAKFDFEKTMNSIGINFTKCVEVIQFRDELVRQFVDIGLDPYKFSRGESLLSSFRVGDFSDVKSYKKCIFEGLRLKLCVFDPVSERYRLVHNNFNITISNPLAAQSPEFIVTNEYSIKANFKGKIGLNSGGLVSVLDGYVLPDLRF